MKSKNRQNEERPFFFTSSFVYLSGFESDADETWTTVLALSASLKFALIVNKQSLPFSQDRYFVCFVSYFNIKRV